MNSLKEQSKNFLNTPMVVDKRIHYDIFSKLLKDRVILLYTAISSESALIINAQLMYLNSIGNDPIHLHINSPGGSVEALFTIINTISIINAPVHGILVGMAASAAAVIFICCDVRIMFFTGTLMLHQVSAGTQGTYSHMKARIEHCKITTYKLYQIILANCSNDSITTMRQVERLCHEDNFLNCHQAKKLGFVDEVRLVTQNNNKKQRADWSKTLMDGFKKFESMDNNNNYLFSESSSKSEKIGATTPK